MEAIEIARKAVETASNKQATDIVLLDIHGLCSFADYFVICSGESDRQIKAIVEEVEKTLKSEDVRPLYRVGTIDSGWVIIDYGEVVVHVFSPAEREYYQLERLWSGAPALLRIQ